MTGDVRRYVRDVLSTTPELSRAARAVLLALSTYVDRTGLCWPSLDELGAVVGLHRQNVRRALRELEADGVIVTTVSSDGRSSNVYRFPLSTGTTLALGEGQRQRWGRGNGTARWGQRHRALGGNGSVALSTSEVPEEDASADWGQLDHPAMQRAFELAQRSQEAAS